MGQTIPAISHPMDGTDLFAEAKARNDNSVECDGSALSDWGAFRPNFGPGFAMLRPRIVSGG
jgi:hypothetical protein